MSGNFVWVSGFPRSGTTLIASYLAQTDQINYIGESYQALIKFQNGKLPKCSCGYFANKCEYWSEIFNSLNQEKNIDQVMRDFFSIISKNSQYLMILDSSKWDKKLLMNSRFTNSTILHVVKNPIGVLSSRKYLRLKRLKNHTHPNSRVAKMTTLLSIYDALSWFRFNVKLNWKYSSSVDVRYIILSYEDFCSQPEKISNILKTIYRFNANFKSKFSIKSNHILQSNLSFLKNESISIIRSNKDNLNWFEKKVAHSALFLFNILKKGV